MGRLLQLLLCVPFTCLHSSWTLLPLCWSPPSLSAWLYLACWSCDKTKGKCLIARAHPLEWVQRKSLLRKVRGLPGSEENNSVREGKNHHTVGRMQKCPRRSAGQSSEESLPKEPSLKIYCRSWEGDPEKRCSALTSFTGSLQGWDSLAGQGEGVLSLQLGDRGLPVCF